MTALWPLEKLDVAALRRSGVRPVPFRQFVLKVNGRCNLACSYCYVYEGADSSWRDRPNRVSPDVVRRTATRIAEHAATHRLTSLQINLHGGEPLLAGVSHLIDQVSAVREAVRDRCGRSCTVDASVQTNGTLLTERAVDRLADAGVRIGVSLDGGTAALNRRRVDHTGRSSWAATVAGLRVLRGRPDAYAGILSVIDPDSDPAEVYTSLTAFEPLRWISCCRTPTTRSRPPRRARIPTATGSSASSTSGSTRVNGPCPYGCSTRSSPCCSGCRPAPRRWATRPSSPSSSTPTAPSSRSTPSRPPTPGRPRPGATSSTTPSTTPWTIRAWWHGSWASTRSPPPASPARSRRCAAAATTRTATARSRASAIPPSTAPTCTSSSRTSPAGYAAPPTPTSPRSDQRTLTTRLLMARQNWGR